MGKLRVVNEISMFETVIFRAGQIIEENDGIIKGDFNGTPINLNVSSFSTDSFEKAEDLDISLQEIIEPEEAISTWRLQLDVKTTRSKAIEIERFLREVLPIMSKS